MSIRETYNNYIQKKIFAFWENKGMRLVHGKHADYIFVCEVLNNESVVVKLYTIQTQTWYGFIHAMSTYEFDSIGFVPIHDGQDVKRFEDCLLACVVQADKITQCEGINNIITNCLNLVKQNNGHVYTDDKRKNKVENLVS